MSELQTQSVIAWLKNPLTIRLQAQRLLELAKANKLNHFSYDPNQLEPTASFVIEVMKSHYPNFDIPYHSRWRHFEAGGIDRIHSLQKQIPKEAFGKIAYELVILSVFLDAGAGSAWSFKETKTNQTYNRSEGLALASLELYQKGAFSDYPKDNLRVDAKALINFNESNFKQGFQITDSNPIEGLEGRVALLNRLGIILQQNPHFFGQEARLGNFYTYIQSLIENNRISALRLFKAVLEAFNTIWPIRETFEGIALGDVGLHQSLKTQNLGSEFIPFHKLSQWLTYSLIEPLEKEGIIITELDQLTGLPEYRNGGLLIDMGLLKLNHPIEDFQNPNSELVVEWRGLTVALLDEIASSIRLKLNKDTQSLPLAKILQGGTWEAGRRIAKLKRKEGTPPIQIKSDGTVF